MKKFLLSLIAIVMSVFSANAAWEKTTTIAVGDVVVLAFDNDNAAKELSGVTTIGTVVDYTTAPEGLYPLTVVAGSTDNTFAFKTTDGTYLSWASGNSLTTSEEVTNASSWTVTFTEAGAADIYNVGTTSRKLQYNASSPRFACYGNSNQQAPYLWKEADENAVLKPIITPSSTTVFAPQEITITAEEGAEIFYSLNGGEDQKYEAPFTVTETTTIEAYAKIEENVSQKAKVVITFGPAYETLAAANEAATNDKVVSRIKLTDALVTYVNGTNTYVQDETGALLIYGNSGLTVGDKVTGYVQGQLYLYSGLPEVANPTVEVEVVSSGNKVVATEVDAAELAANPLKYVSQYVVVKPAKFAEDMEIATKTNVNFTVGETNLVLRNNFTLEFGVEADSEYEVSGLVTIFKDAVQLYPTKAEDIHKVIMIEIDYTSKLSTDVTDWKGASGWCATQFAPAIITKDGREAQLAENYQTNVDATGDLMTQTVTGLANGTYRVTIFGNAFFTSGRGFESNVEEGQDDICYLFAGSGENRVEKFIPAHIATSTTENDKSTLENVLVTDGTLVVGLGKAKAGTNWHTVQVYEITALVNADECLAASVAAAEAIEEATVPAALYSEIAEVVEANNKTYESAAEYEAAIAAIDKVVAKAAPYAPLAEVLAQGEAIKANVTDEAAIAAYDAAIAEVLAAFDAVEVSDFNAAIATVTAALPALAKAQTADGSDLTIVVQNTAWTCEQGNGPNPYSTATETYIDKAPGCTAGKIMYQKIEGLQPGNYEVTFFATLNSCWIGSAAGEGIAQVYANDNTYDIEVIAQGACTPSDYERKLTATVDADGILEYGVQNIATGGNWCVAQAVSLTLVHAFSDAEMAYRAALETLEDGGNYRIFTEVGEKKFYLTNTGYLTASEDEAYTFSFNAVQVDGTLYETGWNLGCKFTNPTLTGGASGDIVNNGHINVGGNNRNDWERQVFFLKDGKYAVRATNANSANWGANTYWDVLNVDAELPNADYSLDINYVWQLEDMALTMSLEELKAAIARGNALAVELGDENIPALAAINLDEITTAEAAEAALAQVKKDIADYVATIEFKGSVNITTGVIANPVPVDNQDGWDGDRAGNQSHGVAEYWNQSGAGFHQTVVLPAGDYKLTVIAMQRTDMTGTVYADENKTIIAQVDRSIANSREQAANWFAEGNGVNEVFFTLEETTEVEIGLKADETTDDHWTVWQSFKLEKISSADIAAAIAAYEAALAAANNLLENDGNVGEELFQKAQSDYDALSAAVTEQTLDTETATIEELEAATAALLEAAETYQNAPVNQPEEGQQYTFKLKDYDFYLALDTQVDRVVINEEQQAFTWVATEGGYYLTNDNGFVGHQVGTNPSDTWTTATTEDHKEVVTATPVMVDGVLYYTIDCQYGGLGLDNTDSGSYLWCDKTGNSRALWQIAKADAVGLKTIETANSETVIYDLAGRRVSKAVKGGVYIINGRKVAIK